MSLVLATQMLGVTVGWQIYDVTKTPMSLAFVGLAQFLPGFLLAIVGGHVADRVDRRKVLVVCHVGVAVCATILAVRSYLGLTDIVPIYSVLVLLGTIRAFSGPAGSALMPNLVEREELQSAIAINSSSWQLSAIVGPSLGGAIYGATEKGHVVYTLSAVLALGACASVFAIGPMKSERPKTTLSWETLLAGLRYVFANKPILGAISLDLFAVLLGGAVALFPVFARDLLAVGPSGLGMLRSAPAAGAATVALALARSPIKRHAGKVMFAGVLAFGVATIVFGLSKSFPLSLAALYLVGASDMLSVVVRSTLIQLRTPDEMRGRVSAVNMVFIGASNELGEFESGLTAAWLGTRAAVVAGGVGTCIVVGTWSLLFPKLRDVDRM